MSDGSTPDDERMDRSDAALMAEDVVRWLLVRGTMFVGALAVLGGLLSDPSPGLQVTAS